MRRALWILVMTLGANAACEVAGPDRSDTYDFRLQPGNAVFHWPADRLPVQYFVPSTGGLGGYATDALAAWESQFLYGEFDAAVTTDSAHADVIVTLQNGTPPGGVLTADPPVHACDGNTELGSAVNGTLTGPVIVRLSWLSGFSGNDVANCLRRTLAHEIGHTLGLLQHSADARDLMFATPAVRDPSPRDRSSVETLYHTQPTIAPAPLP